MSDTIKKLVKESEWTRVFKIGDQEKYLYESKFLMDDLHVSSTTLKQRWPSLSLNEKVEFSTSFSSQPPRDAEDSEILQFLMEKGPQEVWRNIAILLPFHPRPDEARTFLLMCLNQDPQSRANYYQAIALLNDTNTVPALRSQFEEYQAKLASNPSQNSEFWSDYIQCTNALWTLTRDSMFFSTIKESVKKAPRELQAYIKNLLQQVEGKNGGTG
jgi:hypothetical protein